MDRYDDDDRKSYDKKSYGNDNSYKPQYTSYDKDDSRDKSKDDNKSVDIKKIKCINTNLNINGNNTADINVGNKGQVNLGGYSSAGSGYGGEGYNNNKNDKGFTCIINNNNTNIGGNVTDGNGNETNTCEECFERFLTPTELTALDELLIGTLETYCNLIGAGDVEEDDLRATLVMVIGQGQKDRIDSIIDCLLEIGVVFAPPT